MENCVSPKRIIQHGVMYRVPCGTCPLCLNARRMSWLMRIEHEHKTTDMPFQWFLTLTYNERKVPKRAGVKTLYKRHPQLFFKRLRKRGYKIKYILVGEYGSKTHRPHYHVIAWTDAPAGEIDRSWSYGHVHYRHIGRGSILYTLKYILNPREGDNKVKQKEYAVFSKGLGASYLSDAMARYHNPAYCGSDLGLPVVDSRLLDERLILTTVVDGRVVPLPRYYREKLFSGYQKYRIRKQMYYVALRKRLNAVRRFKELGYKNPFHQVKIAVLEAARQVKVKSSRSKEKL